MASKITRLNRTLKCQNRMWNIYFDHIKEDKNEVENYFVAEPKVVAENHVTGIGTLPIVDGEIGLLNIHRVAIDKNMLEIPRGYIDPDEEPLQAARRELEEESGLICLPEDMIPLGSVVPESSTLAARMMLFAALNCIKSAEVIEDEIGLGQLNFFSIEEIKSKIAYSEIEDASTATVLLRLFLGQETDPRISAALNQSN
jgi:8-oxo-dGDP phosphatase